jgi:hypothetical protein
MKTPKTILKTGLIVLWIFIVGCGGFSKSKCHIAALESIYSKGYKIDTAFYNGWHTIVVTTDSCIWSIESRGLEYPYITDIKIIKNY